MWVNDAIIKSALADCGDGGSAHSESNLSSKSSFDNNAGLSSSRKAKWVWIESVVVSGSVQGLSSSTRPVPTGRLADDEVLTIRVTDPQSEHNGRVFEIAKRHLGVVGGRGVLPANTSKSDSDLPSDLTQLTHLHEPAVVDCLHRRYKLSGWKMYTSSGPILIAINPCRDVPGLYDENAMKMYWRWGERLANGVVSSSGGSDGSSANEMEATPPPHVFGVADSAYRGMMRGLDFARSSIEEEQKDEEVSDDFVSNQSVLVSGESGAGKTGEMIFLE